jgi:hypothetical protein
MWFYLFAAAVFLHTCFWGAGLSALVLPRRWRRWWWVFCPGLGLALQSAVVWTGAHTNLPGTNSYAAWSEVLPAALLVLGWRRRGEIGRAFAALRGAIGLAAIIVVAGWLLLSPMAAVSGRPTTISIGSCDAADYAAGARVLQEFAHDDHVGFLGLTEVTHIRSVDYFFDFWLRLNHFTPSAVLAHNGSILRERPHALAGVTGVALVLLNLPATMFLARVAMGLRRGWLLGLTALLAVSPLQAYAVFHVALGQLFAVQGILLLTIAVFGAVRHGRPWACAPLAVAGFWILAGSYNMLLPVCLAPAGAWLVAQAFWRRNWRVVATTIAMLGAALAVCAAFGWARFAGLAERFSLLNQYDFGWPVPLVTPEGWLGLITGPRLQPWPAAGRLLAIVVTLVAWLAGVAGLWRRRRGSALAALAFVTPVAFGWALLAWEAHVRANASYDAYKLIAAFQPEFVIGLGCVLALPQAGSFPRRQLVALVLALVLCGNLFAIVRFRHAATHSALRVHGSLLELSSLERDARIRSVNMRLTEFWARLWANQLLLRMPQYFETHSYEGRLNTEMKGEWDLSDSPIHTIPFFRKDYIAINGRFHLTRVGADGEFTASFGRGWHAPESGSVEGWRWTSGDAEIKVVNPGTRPLRVHVSLRAHALTPRDLHVLANDVEVGACKLGTEPEKFDLGELVLAPGPTTLALRASLPAGWAGGDDDRMLSVALHKLTLRAIAAP